MEFTATAAARSSRRATTCVPHPRSVRRRRRRRRGHGPHRRARRADDGRIEAASPRLAVSGTGRIALNPEADAELTFRFTDTSLDPYVRTVRARAVAVHDRRRQRHDARRRRAGRFDHLLVDGTVEQLELRLFDYPLENANPIRLALDRNTREDRAHAPRRRRTPSSTWRATIDLHDERIGAARDRRRQSRHPPGLLPRHPQRGPGRARGGDRRPAGRSAVLSGAATITDGRLRHFALPHSLEAINGTRDVRRARRFGSTS